MHQVVFEVVESVDGGYEATALGHRIHTQGEDWEDLKAMVQDAVRGHFGEQEMPLREPLLVLSQPHPFFHRDPRLSKNRP
jgi:hypothetical protein